MRIVKWSRLGRSGGLFRSARQRFLRPAERIARSAGRALLVESLEPRQLLNADSLGSEFWLAFQQNFDSTAPSLSLFLTGPTATSGTVEIPGLGFTRAFDVTPGQVTTVTLPTNAFVSTNDGIENRGIRVTAASEIAVYGLNLVPFTTDGFVGLPVDILGTEYIALTYPGLGVDRSSPQFAVVATEDATQITVTPSISTGSRPANVPYTVALSRGQVYQLSNTTAVGGDLTGSIVSSNKPVAVFSGNSGAQIPRGTAAVDHIVDQMTPTVTWGTNFVTVPLALRTAGDRFRIVAAEAGTQVRIDGTLVATLNRGGVFETVQTASRVITSSKPVMVAQFAQGRSADNTTGDPFMAVLPPIEQLLTGYTFSTPSINFPTNYVNLWTPTQAVSSVRLNGAPVNASLFTPIGTSGFSGARVPVPVGTNTVSSDFPLGALVYGFNSFDSYGYAGGSSLVSIGDVASVTVSARQEIGYTGRPREISAFVLDDQGLPVFGARVDFTVTGENPQNGFAFTRFNGEAVFTYTGNNPGTDQVRAGVGAISATTGVVWRSPPNLLAESVNAPASGRWNAVVSIDFDITNSGAGPTDSTWIDRVLLSTDAVPDANDRLIGSVNALTALNPGGTYRTTISGVIPSDRPAGQYFLIALADATNIQYETNDADNFVAVPFTLTAPDLVVEGLQFSVDAPRDPISGDLVTVRWSEVNRGTASANGSWVSRVRVVARGDGRLISDTVQLYTSNAIDPGLSVERERAFRLPDGLPGTGLFDVVVTADSDGRLPESNPSGNAETNNALSGAFESSLAPYPELLVESVTTLGPAVFGSSVEVRWSVRNAGNLALVTPISDRVYLSRDGQLDAGDRLLATLSAASQLPLEPGATYTRTGTVSLPIDTQLLAGGYQFIVVTDALGQQFELDESNNSRAGDVVQIALPPFPDLTVSSISTVAEVIAGQTIPVTWTITNSGDGAATGTWTDRLLFSADGTIGSDIVLTGFAVSATLAPGASLTRTQNVTIPEGLAGVYRVVVLTDAGNAVQEFLNEGNNAAIDDLGINVLVTPRPNLVVDAVITPPSAFSGQALTVEWIVKNIGTSSTNAAGWFDRVYLSLDEVIDATDVVLGNVLNASYLNVGESYRNAATATLPQGINSAYRIIIRTDQNNQVNEGANESDNTRASAPLQVNLTPPPDLVVTAVTAPLQAFSGQPISVNWTVANQGPGPSRVARWSDRVFVSFNDAVLDPADALLGTRTRIGELVSGADYSASLEVTLPIGITGSAKFIVLTDAFSEVFEHVFETNNAGVQSTTTNVLLTPPPDLTVASIAAPSRAAAGQPLAISYTVSNDGATATPNNAWSDAIYLSTDQTLNVGSDLLLGVRSRSGVLDIGETENRSFTFTLSNTLSGSYFVIVHTDNQNQVFEVNNANNIVATTVPVDVVIAPPDLVVTGVEVRSGVFAGRDVEVRYSVRNQGANPTPVVSWNDSFYLSADSVVDGSDALLGTVGRSGVLEAGQSETRTATLRLPVDRFGSRFIIAVSDSGNAVFELDQNNNTAAVAVTVADDRPDLRVTAFTPRIGDGTAVPGATLAADFRVENAGAGATFGTAWIDQLVLSADSVAGNTDDVFLASVTSPLLVGSGEGYSRASLNFTIPASTPIGVYRLFAIADAQRRVSETDDANNASQGVEIAVVSQSTFGVPDLQVSEVVAPATNLSGGSMSISWTVVNRGQIATPASAWVDRVWLSRDQAIDEQDIAVGGFTRSDRLDPDASYTRTITYSTDLNLSGDFYVIVQTDATNAVFEGGVQELNNARMAPAPTAVTLRPSPDLTPVAVVPPTQLFSGRAHTIEWTIRNAGQGAAEGTWFDSVFLSLDQVFDPASDISLGFSTRNGPIAAGGEYTASGLFSVPQALGGRYYVFVVTDTGNRVAERGAEGNNALYASASVEIVFTPPADLVVGDIVIPADGSPGRNATITYTVRNTGQNPASGTWTDALFISGDGAWDINDPLFGRVQVSATVAPGSSYTRSLTAPLPGVLPGGYKVIIRSDIRNNLPEDDEGNNFGASLGDFDIDIEIIATGASSNGVIGSGTRSYFRVVGPEGSVRRVSVATLNNAATGDLYVGATDVPSTARFDRRSEGTLSPSPEIYVQMGATESAYVLLAGNTGNANFTIRSEDVPFGAIAATPGVVTSVGAATLKIRGARFDDQTRFQIVGQFRGRPAVVEASRTLIEDGLTAYATFNFAMLDEGTWTLRSVRGDVSADLSGAVRVGSGDLGAVQLDVTGDLDIRPNRVVPLAIEFGNVGFSDVDVPLLAVESSPTPRTGSSPADLALGDFHVLALPGDGFDDALRPGQFGTIPFVFLSPTAGADFALRVNQYQSQSLEVLTEEKWARFEQAARPSSLTEEQWATFWSGIRATVGETVGDYVSFLQRIASDHLDRTGERVRTVRSLLDLAYRQDPQFRAGAPLAGRLLNAADATPIGERRVLAYRVTPTGERVLERVTTATAGGAYAFASLPIGVYDFAVEGHDPDQNRDGDVDDALFRREVLAEGGLGVDLFIKPELVYEADVPERLSPVAATDRFGVPNLVWSENGELWHAFVSEGAWVHARPIAGTSGAQGLRLFAAGAGAHPDDALVATWRAGEGNASELFTATARRSEGRYVWSEPVRLTENAWEDRQFASTLLNDGRMVTFVQRTNADAEDDTDLYGFFSQPGGTLFLAPPPADPVVSGPEQTDSISISMGLEESVFIPQWIPYIGGLYSFDISGSIEGERGCEEASLSGGLEAELKTPIKGFKVSGSGSASANFSTDKPNCRYVFESASVSGSVSGNARLPMLPIPIVLPTPIPIPIGLIEWGPSIGASASLTGSWKQWPIDRWPDSVTLGGELSGGGGFEAEAFLLFGSLEVSGSATFKSEFTYDGVNFKAENPEFCVSATAEFEWWDEEWTIEWERCWDIPSNRDPGTFKITVSGSIGTLTAHFDPSGEFEAAPQDMTADTIPEVVRLSDGRVLLSWFDEQGLVSRTFDPATGTLGPIQSVVSDGLVATNLKLAPAADGSVLAAWTGADLSALTPGMDSEEAFDAIRSPNRLFVAKYDPTTGTWGAPTLLDGSTDTIKSYLSLDTLADGRVVASWQGVGDDAGRLFAAVADAGGNFGVPTLVGVASLAEPATAMVVDGVLTLAWSQQVGDENEVGSNRRMFTSTLRDSGWSAPVAFTPQLDPALLTTATPDLPAERGGQNPPWRPPADCCGCGDRRRTVIRGSGDCEVAREFDPVTCVETIYYKPCVRNPVDPNDILGPDGFGPEEWVSSAQPLGYTIRFENDPQLATAPAQVVRITQTLDSDLDPRTFRLGNFGFGERTFQVPANRAFYSERIDLRNDLGIFVDVVAGVNIATSEVFWTLTSIDPATGDIPLGADVGFLPPNVTPPEGDGFVTYTVRARAGVAEAARVDAEASIVFDTEAPIITPPIFNTLDTRAPSAVVAPLPARTDDLRFRVTWAGGDGEAGSGIAFYSVYVSENGADYEPWLDGTTQIEGEYTGVVGRRYRFYVLATDNVGNVQPVPAAAQAETIVGPEAPQLAGAQIDEGGRQRSMVRSFSVRFDQPIATLADAFTLTRNGSTFDGQLVITNPSGDGKSFVISFAGAGIIGGSLTDGLYSLTINAAGVSDRFGQTLASGDATYRFYRLFGDGDGDRDMDTLDLGRMRQALGSRVGDDRYKPELDFEADGDIDAVDFGQARSRLGTVLPPDRPDRGSIKPGLSLNDLRQRRGGVAAAPEEADPLALGPLSNGPLELYFFGR